MGYKKNKCPECGSYNITPFNKRQVGKKGICEYVCEECGCEMGETVYYIRGRG